MTLQRPDPGRQLSETVFVHELGSERWHLDQRLALAHTKVERAVFGATGADAQARRIRGRRYTLKRHLDRALIRGRCLDRGQRFASEPEVEVHGGVDAG